MKVTFAFILALLINSLTIANASSVPSSGVLEEDVVEEQASSAKYHMGWPEAQALASSIADHCKETGIAFKGILMIMRGGGVPGTLLTQKLNIKNSRTICLESYSDEHKKGNIRIISQPTDIIDEGEGWLVVDDIADSGATLEYSRKLYPKAHYVTMVSKPIGKAHTDFSAKDFPQDTWIVFPWEDK